MKYFLDTNVIISHFKGDTFSNDTDHFFEWIRNSTNKIFISDIVYAELYTGIFLTSNPSIEEKRIQRFLAVNEIEVKFSSLKMVKRSGELYARYLLKNKKSTVKRILPDFIIGAHAEQFADVLVTWNPSDYDLEIDVLRPREVIEHSC